MECLQNIDLRQSKVEYRSRLNNNRTELDRGGHLAKRDDDTSFIELNVRFGT